MPTDSPPFPRWLRIGLVTEFLLPSLIIAITEMDFVGTLAPFAGPWAARLYGHSCGVESFLPLVAFALLITGVACAVLAVRVRRPWAVAPLALLWWPAWVFTASISVLNTLS